jgi:molecular chaperone HscB
MVACTSCGAALVSALVCEACGALQSAGTAAPAAPASIDPWDALGLPRAYALDAGALKKRLLALQRRMHPDFFGGAAAAERELAERNTAELNAAHRVLADDALRADRLVRALGGPDDQVERQMPQAFLMEVLEWNETLEEAREAALHDAGSPASARLDELERELRAERAAALARVAAALDPVPSAGAPVLLAVRRELNAVRYLDRTLSTLAELRLDAARSTR